jgi:hypothetical protein
MLLRVQVQTFVPAGGWVEMIFDETLERRWGRRITTRSGSAKNAVIGATVWLRAKG